MRAQMVKSAIDVLGLVGLVLIAYGVHQIYPPAAYIVGGLALSGTALLLALRAE